MAMRGIIFRNFFWDFDALVSMLIDEFHETFSRLGIIVPKECRIEIRLNCGMWLDDSNAG